MFFSSVAVHIRLLVTIGLCILIHVYVLVFIIHGYWYHTTDIQKVMYFMKRKCMTFLASNFNIILQYVKYKKK